MDKKISPFAGTVPEPKADKVPEEGGSEEYADSLQQDIEKSKTRIHRRFLFWLEYALPWGAAVLVMSVLLGILAFLFTWVFHILAPTNWWWLEIERVERIQEIFFSGLSGALATALLRWYFSRDDNQKN